MQLLCQQLFPDASSFSSLTYMENFSAPLNLVPREECEDNVPHADKVTQRDRPCFTGLTKAKAWVVLQSLQGLVMKLVKCTDYAIHC